MDTNLQNIRKVFEEHPVGTFNAYDIMFELKMEVDINNLVDVGSTLESMYKKGILTRREDETFTRYYKLKVD